MYVSLVLFIHHSPDLNPGNDYDCFYATAVGRCVLISYNLSLKTSKNYIDSLYLYNLKDFSTGPLFLKCTPFLKDLILHNVNRAAIPVSNLLHSQYFQKPN